MIYQNYIHFDYEYDFFSDNEISNYNFGSCYLYYPNAVYEVEDNDIYLNNDLTILSLLGGATYYGRTELNRSSDLLAISFNTFNDDDYSLHSCLFLTTQCDFAMISKRGGDSTDINIEGRFFTDNDVNSSLNNSSYIETYDNTNYSSVYNNISYGDYSRTITGSYGSAVFDTSNVKLNDGDSAIFSLRGENVSIHRSFLELYCDNFDVPFFLGVGNIYRGAYDTGYESGYSNGLANGYVSGYDNGYATGLQSNGNMTSTANAFDYIGNAFGAVANIMSLEVLPNITLGIAFAIPLVFVLIMTIFRLVRK